MKKFKDKKILFLSAAFFDYEKVIVERLQNFGADVQYYNERPSDSTLTKGIIRIHRNVYKNKIRLYYQKILNEIADKTYDFLLIIKGETVPEFFLKQFKLEHSKTTMIYYGYDPIAEYPVIKKILKFFDKKLIFDRQDAAMYGMQFRPLFYNENYLNKEKILNFKFDVSFVGSAHTDRFLVGNKVEKMADALGLKTYFYYFSPSRTSLMFKKIFDKNLKKIDLKKIRFKQLSHPKISEIYKNSKAVLDIQKPYQRGLTMRTFEVLASGRKLITTNADVVHYPFYSAENVLIINRDQPVLPKQFFETPFKILCDEVVYKMSLDSWLEDVFFEEEISFW